MSRKYAERAFVRFARAQGWYSHKYKDKARCIQCGALQPKSERIVDYALAPIFDWIEVKESNAQGYYYFDTLSQNQRDWLDENDGWMFLVLGTGRAPKERSAFLIPWTIYRAVEADLRDNGQKSLRREGGRKLSGLDVFGDYMLYWRDGAWYPPRHHPFVQHLLMVLTDAVLYWSDNDRSDTSTE